MVRASGENQVLYCVLKYDIESFIVKYYFDGIVIVLLVGYNMAYKEGFGLVRDLVEEFEDSPSLRKLWGMENLFAGYMKE